MPNCDCSFCNPPTRELHRTIPESGLEPTIPPATELLRIAQCGACGTETDQARESENEGQFCPECYSERFSACENCSAELDTHNGDENTADVNGSAVGPYCLDCFERLIADCHSCREPQWIADMSTFEGDTYCEDCHCDTFTSCDDCGDTIARDDCVSNGDSSYCAGCAPETDGGDFSANRFRPAENTYSETGSARTFGVELETSSCPNHMDLAGEVYFSSRDDGSINGKEFVSGILSGDKGLAAIESFCQKARRFAVDSSCGFHAHFGIRDLTVSQRVSVAWAYHRTYETWASFVPAKRRENHFCGGCDWGFDDVAFIADDIAWELFCGRLDRYQWVNFAAYLAHGTVEIRLHSATLDSTKIRNWIVANLRFIESVKDLSIDQISKRFGGNRTAQSTFRALADCWNRPALVEYYRQRAASFGVEYRELQAAS